MARVAGWQRRLNEYILDAQERYKSAGFQPGVFDCVHFVADWVKVLTGEDPLGEYRNAYTTEEEGFLLVAQKEGSLEEALRNRFGDPIPPSLGQRGDIATLRIDDRLMCGILFTSGAKMRALFLGEGGFALHRVSDVTHVFPVR